MLKGLKEFQGTVHALNIISGNAGRYGLKQNKKPNPTNWNKNTTTPNFTHN